MSFTQQTQLTTLPTGPTGLKRYALSWLYDFSADEPALQGLGSEAFWGTVFELSSSQATSNIGALSFNSLLFTVQFDGASTDAGVAIADGAFYVYNPALQKLDIFGMDQSLLGPNPSSPPDSVNHWIYALTGCIPVLGTAPTTLQFGKGVDTLAPGGISGKLWAVLLTDVIAPYTRAGFYQRTQFDAA